MILLEMLRKRNNTICFDLHDEQPDEIHLVADDEITLVNDFDDLKIFFEVCEENLLNDDLIWKIYFEVEISNKVIEEKDQRNQKI
jgi:hypothetical protein